MARHSDRQRSVQAAQFIHHSVTAHVFAYHHCHAVCGQPHTVYCRQRASCPCDQYVLLDHIYIHDAWRVPERGRESGCSSRRRQWLWWRGSQKILHVLSVGVFCTVLPSNFVLPTEIHLGRGRGWPHEVHRHGPEHWNLSRGGQMQQEEDSDRLPPTSRTGKNRNRKCIIRKSPTPPSCYPQWEFCNVKSLGACSINYWRTRGGGRPPGYGPLHQSEIKKTFCRRDDMKGSTWLTL